MRRGCPEVGKLGSAKPVSTPSTELKQSPSAVSENLVKKHHTVSSLRGCAARRHLKLYCNALCEIVPWLAQTVAKPFRTSLATKHGRAEIPLEVVCLHVHTGESIANEFSMFSQVTHSYTTLLGLSPSSSPDPPPLLLIKISSRIAHRPPKSKGTKKCMLHM